MSQATGGSSTANPSPLYKEARNWLESDWQRVEQALKGRADVFRGKRVLVTGAAGFLGFNFLHWFSYLNEKRGKAHVSVAAADNYLRGEPRWIRELSAHDQHLSLRRVDVTAPWPTDERFDFIIHGASIASPRVYRQYPLETLDANILGLRHMLELCRRSQSESLLFFSSSEIYGDPPADQIPTTEHYRGNVACIGPRACYDESKRVGETICYLYAQQHKVPAKIVRPFNNYGPGLRLADGRVLPDLCRDALSGRDITLRSDGTPTRTFCYASDALTGYLLALLSSHQGEPFNIGSDGPEVSMRDVANLVLRLSASRRTVVHEPSEERDYLTDNPLRRCPDITKARTWLGFSPQVSMEVGVARALEWYTRFVALEEIVSA